MVDVRKANESDGSCTACGSHTKVMQIRLGPAGQAKLTLRLCEECEEELHYKASLVDYLCPTCGKP